MKSNQKRIKTGVEKYKKIMRLYSTVNVTKNQEFQKLYNGFYRIRQRKLDWYKQYYQMLKDLKSRNLSFGEILTKLEQRTGRVEASFASKMYATRNPKYPIIDKWVLKYFGIRLPSTYANNRIEKIIEKYDHLIVCYQNLISTDAGANHIKDFDNICPGTHIADVKKIDFILWQKR